MSVRALVYVQHLLGIGHLARANLVASGLQSAGIQTTLVQGGVDAGLASLAGLAPFSGLAHAPDVELIRLNPVKVTASDMTTLLHADGRVFSESDKAERRDHLLSTLQRTRPHIILVEAFPFGRRPMRFELLPLLEEAGTMKTPLVASSIRDLLQDGRKPGRAEETVAWVNRHFDLVLVHGDPLLTPLARTFPLADQIAAKTRYTGLVGPDLPKGVHRDHAVVVSAGGGVVGARLLEAAIQASQATHFRDEPWLVLTGPNMPDSEFLRLHTLAAMTSPKITVIRSVPHLSAHLAGAKLSISQAGYNTVADILVAGCAAVVSPFAENGETEQTTRAEALAASGRCAMIKEDALSTDGMAAAINRALLLPRATAQVLNGRQETARILLEELDRVTGAKKSIDFRKPLLSSSGGGKQ